MKVLGIDPGLGGALAVIETAPRLRCVDAVRTPTILEGAKRRPDVRWILHWILEHAPARGFVERAQAMPAKGRHGKEGEEEWAGQGASSAFIYGRATGYVEATTLCAGVRLHLVEAFVWKRDAGLILPKGSPRRSTSEVKEASRQLAIETFPLDTFLFEKKSEHGRAEAALIALHGWRTKLRGTDEAPAEEAKEVRELRAPEDRSSGCEACGGDGCVHCQGTAAERQAYESAGG
jgi:hypothetical protein